MSFLMSRGTEITLGPSFLCTKLHVLVFKTLKPHFKFCHILAIFARCSISGLTQGLFPVFVTKDHLKKNRKLGRVRTKMELKVLPNHKTFLRYYSVSLDYLLWLSLSSLMPLNAQPSHNQQWSCCCHSEMSEDSPFLFPATSTLKWDLFKWKIPSWLRLCLSIDDGGKC